MVALQTRRGGGSITWAIGGLALIGVSIFVASGWLGDAEATDHSRLHAAIGSISALIAVAIVTRWGPAGLAASAPAASFALFSVAQLVEGVGTLGYDTIDDTRNDLAVLHDVGIGLSELALLSVVVGIAIGLAVASARQRGAVRLIGTMSALIALGAGVMFFKVMIGM